MKFKTKLVDLVVADLKKRERKGDSDYLHGADRVEVSHVAHLHFRVKKGRFEFDVDEPPERGGTGTGPNPLAYFLAGAASCLSTQFARLIIAKSMKVKRFNMTALGRFDRLLGGSFREVVYDVVMTGEESESAVARLAARAQLQCYAHNTLRKAGVELTMKVTWNGKRLKVPPASATL